MEGGYSCSVSALEEVMSKVELRGLGERSSAHTDGGGPEGGVLKLLQPEEGPEALSLLRGL